jgi:hypothetical protein
MCLATGGDRRVNSTNKHYMYYSSSWRVHLSLTIVGSRYILTLFGYFYTVSGLGEVDHELKKVLKLAPYVRLAISFTSSTSPLWLSPNPCLFVGQLGIELYVGFDIMQFICDEVGAWIVVSEYIYISARTGGYI